MKILRHAFGRFRDRMSAALFGSVALWMLERIADKFIERAFRAIGLF
jgi:hypothetical protein